MAAVAASCGGGAATISRADARAGDAFELRATVGGSFAKLLGSSHEWYAPRSGAFTMATPPAISGASQATAVVGSAQARRSSRIGR